MEVTLCDKNHGIARISLLSRCILDSEAFMQRPVVEQKAGAVVIGPMHSLETFYRIHIADDIDCSASTLAIPVLVSSRYVKHDLGV